MKQDKIFIILAFILVLAYPLITAAYVYIEIHQFQFQKFLPRMVLLGALCYFAFQKHNWARLALAGISLLVVIGSTAGIVLHFYRHQTGLLEPLLYVQLIEYAAVSFLLLWPQSVRDFYQKK